MPESSIPTSVIVVGMIAILIVLALFAMVAIKARRVDLTPPGDEKPDWMRNTPPKETIAATRTDGKGMQVFGHGQGEALASPFAEQIEDILHAALERDPAMKKYSVDLGTAPDGSLEISVNGEKYTDIEAIPDPKLKELLKQAVAKWKKS
jgi:hypothetical protein